MGKLVAQRNVRWEGDLFNIFQLPYQFQKVTPQTIQSVDLLASSWGTVGSVIYWTYNIGGAKNFSKEIIEVIGFDEKKSGQVAVEPTAFMDFLIDFSKEIDENSRGLVPN